VNGEPVRILTFRIRSRGGRDTVIATLDALLFDLLRVNGIEIHRRVDDGRSFCWVVLPKPLEWVNSRVAHRFRAHLLTLVGREHPGFLQAGILTSPSPLLQHHMAEQIRKAKGGDYDRNKGQRQS
jgi:hypothetical protein